MLKDSKSPGVSRRSILRIAGAGATASLAGTGLTRPAFAQSGGDVDKAIAWAKANLPKSTPEIITAAAKEGKLTVTLLLYGDDKTMKAFIAKFNEHYPFIEVDYTMQQVVQLQQKFNAELSSKRGISDYVHPPSSVTEAQKYINSGAFAEFVVSDDAAYSPDAKQSGYWYAWNLAPTVTVYRKGALSDEEKQLIRTYKGLGDPRFKGRLGTLAIESSTTIAVSYLLQNDPDQSIWERLVANKPKVKGSGGELLNGVLGGEFDIGLMDALATPTQSAKSGDPIEFVVSAPCPHLYSGFGAISGLAPHPNAAKLWADWSASKEARNLFVELTGIISARSDAEKAWVQQQPWYYDDESQAKAIDWDDYGKKQDAVIARFRKDMQTS